MFYVDVIPTSKSSHMQSELPKSCMLPFFERCLPFERADTGEAITMEDCTAGMIPAR
ncbi:MAG: hypothetical protein Q4D60_01595 [Eubacteriales bacterium]|nr:hypothetical protein [Eubacteriales bacterium]